MSNNLTVQEKINKVKSFLAGEGERATGGTFEGTYKTPILGLKGTTQGEIKTPFMPLPNGTVLSVLQEMRDNQNLERIRYEKTNSIAGDIDIRDWQEVTLPHGYQVFFELIIPEGWVAHIKWTNCSYNPLTVYSFDIDGRYEPNMSEFLMDWADHYETFVPPIRAYSTAIITAINLSGVDQVYSCYFGGFLRRYKRTSEIATEETSYIEKSIGA